MKYKKILFETIAASLLGMSIIAGGTYALFVTSTTTDVAINSGSIEIDTNVDELVTFSGVFTGSGYESYPTAVNGMFSTGGTAVVKNELGLVELSNMVPMDKVQFTLNIKNKSNVLIKYRTKLSVVDDDGLFAGLNVYCESKEASWEYYGETTYTPWVQIEPSIKNVDKIRFTIELPEDAGIEFSGKKCKLAYSIESIQGNAHTIDSDTNDVLKIYSAFDLVALRKSVNSGNLYEGKTVTLMNDIDMTNVSFSSIGNDGSDRTFVGTFDGNNKTISHMYIDDTNNAYAGLFNIFNGVAKNLTIRDSFVNGKRAGVFAGAVDYGEMHNIKILNSEARGEQKNGGLIGYLKNQKQAIKNETIVDSCYVENTIISNPAVNVYTDVTGAQNGGLIGAIATCTNATIKNNTVKNILFDGCIENIDQYVASKNNNIYYQYCSHPFIASLMNVGTTSSGYEDYIITMENNQVIGDYSSLSKTIVDDEYCGFHYCQLTNRSRNLIKVLVDGVERYNEQYYTLCPGLLSNIYLEYGSEAETAVQSGDVVDLYVTSASGFRELTVEASQFSYIFEAGYNGKSNVTFNISLLANIDSNSVENYGYSYISISVEECADCKLLFDGNYHTMSNRSTYLFRGDTGGDISVTVNDIKFDKYDSSLTSNDNISNSVIMGTVATSFCGNNISITNSKVYGEYGASLFVCYIGDYLNNSLVLNNCHISDCLLDSHDYAGIIANTVSSECDIECHSCSATNVHIKYGTYAISQTCRPYFGEDYGIGIEFSALIDMDLVNVTTEYAYPLEPGM